MNSRIERAVALRFHEIALKGLNRRWFEEKLANNARKLIQRALAESGSARQDIAIQHTHGRILIETEWNEEVRGALTRLFGISSFSPIRKAPTQLDAVIQATIEETGEFLRRHGKPKHFRVRTRRTDKVFPETSVQLDRVIGSAVCEAFPELEVELEKPELVVGVELRFEKSFIWTEKVPGHGGLPVGSNGKLLALISGGLDSPVAAIQTLRRGSPTGFVHFHGAPFVGEEVLEKIKDLVRLVNRYQPDPQPLQVVPFGKLQERIALVTNPKMRTLLYRRMMVRIACSLAGKTGAQALVTGESLGQVASQTVENLSTVNAVATLPIIRPLITLDKDEIITLAQKWGTYETSIRPGLDCCTLFADRHPTLRSSVEMMEEQEAQLPIQEMVEEAVAGTQNFSFKADERREALSGSAP